MEGTVQCPDYDDLRRAMEEVPLGDGDEWLAALLGENPRLALRIIEVSSPSPGGNRALQKQLTVTGTSGMFRPCVLKAMYDRHQIRSAW